MQIYLARNNQQAGPYSLEQINQMLASQQVLLTDLAWHHGMSEWKALGELTQGKLVYQPSGYVAQSTTPSIDTTTKTETIPPKTELASIGQRAIAKVFDVLLWLPAAAIPSFFLKPEQFEQLTNLQSKMQTATTSTQAGQFQSELFTLIPTEAWQAVIAYLLIMLVLQAILITKTGQSVGKRITKIQIVDQETNQSVSLLRGFTLRSFLMIFLTFLAFPIINLIDYAFSLGEKRQTLHDKLAKTKVIKKK